MICLSDPILVSLGLFSSIIKKSSSYFSVISVCFIEDLGFGDSLAEMLRLLFGLGDLPGDYGLEPRDGRLIPGFASSCCFGDKPAIA